MDDRNRLALRLSYDLAGVTDRETYLYAMIESLAVIFPVDSNGWVGIDLPRGRFEFLGTNGSGTPEHAERVARNREAHPMYTSYVSRSSDLTPRRISDMVGDRDWLNDPLYAEVFVPLGARREMTIVVTPVTATEFNGWGFHRAFTDFTDNELELATSIQPLLVALNRLTAIGTTARPDKDGRVLTLREAQILQLVAEGFRAVDIALMLRISPATVRKHMEHAYEKLGEHNRVRAVSAAVRAGEIAGHAGSTPNTLR